MSRAGACMGDLELLDIENIIVSSSSHACQIVVQMQMCVVFFSFNFQLAPDFASKQKGRRLGTHRVIMPAHRVHSATA